MRKFTLVLSCLSIFAFTIQAQSSHKLLNLKNNKQVKEQNTGSSAINYRIIAIRSYTMNGGVWEGGDSTALTYSGTRGSDIVANEIKFDQQTAFDWDGFLYTPDYRYSRTYNSMDMVTEELDETYNGALWENDFRDLYSYNSNDKLASRTRQTWNGATWEDNYRYVYAYNNGMLAGETQQDWNGSAWENDFRYVYSYDGNGNRTSRLYQDWNGSSWEDASRHVYSYDANGNEIQDLYQTWNGSAWEDSYRYVTQYDAENWMTSDTRQNWNGSSWENYSRSIYTHNTGDYYYSEIISQDYNGSAWENDYKYVYTFTSFNKIDEAISSDWDGALWAEDTRSVVHYEQYDDGLSGIETTKDLGIKVYPNPAADYVMFRNGGSEKEMTIEIFNIEGRLVKTLSGSSNLKWYTDRNVASGIYNYVISINDEKQSGQIVVR